jgi:hypothetical protein
VEGGCEAKVVVEELVPEGVAVQDGVIDVEQRVKVVFIFVGWWPCNSFSANIAS